MIGIFIGEQNSGKTLSMTYFALDYLRGGYKVYSNYGMNFKHEEIKIPIIMDWVKNKEQLNKSIVCLDEMYLMLDCRNFGSKSNKILSYFALQTSKRNVHLFGTAQYFNTIERRIRDNCGFIVKCSRFTKDRNGNFNPLNKNLRILPKTNIYIKLTVFVRKEGVLVRTGISYLHANPLYKLYDTSYLVDLE